MAATGKVVTYRELDDESNRAANLLRSLGLKPGDTIALFAENHPRYYQVLWAAQRSGLYYTAISSRLTAEEAAYIVNDSGAKVFITTLRDGRRRGQDGRGQYDSGPHQALHDGRHDRELMNRGKMRLARNQRLRLPTKPKAPRCCTRRAQQVSPRA